MPPERQPGQALLPGFNACHYCPADATRLCDFLTEVRPDGTVTTCDRPICPAHGQQVSAMHIRWSRRQKDGSRGSWETIDICQDHLPAWQAKYGSNPA